jgi:hypothetical protein
MSIETWYSMKLIITTDGVLGIVAINDIRERKLFIKCIKK